MLECYFVNRNSMGCHCGGYAAVLGEGERRSDAGKQFVGLVGAFCHVEIVEGMCWNVYLYFFVHVAKVCHYQHHLVTRLAQESVVAERIER